MPCLVKATLHALTTAAQFVLLASVDICEDFEQFQVTLGCDIVVSGKLSQVLFTLPGYCLVDLHTHQCLERGISLRDIVLNDSYFGI